MYLQVGRPDKIHVPYELREAVELYAREHGRTGSLHCIPPGVWFARFSLRPNDKALSLYQKGEVAEAPTEVVYFQIRADHYNPEIHAVRPEFRPRPGKTRPIDMLPLDLLQMGPSGVRQFLEEGNTWSGRGRFASQLEAVKAAERANADMAAKAKELAFESARYRERDTRKSRWGIPVVQGADLTKDD